MLVLSSEWQSKIESLTSAVSRFLSVARDTEFQRHIFFLPYVKENVGILSQWLFFMLKLPSQVSHATLSLLLLFLRKCPHLTCWKSCQTLPHTLQEVYSVCAPLVGQGKDSGRTVLSLVVLAEPCLKPGAWNRWVQLQEFMCGVVFFFFWNHWGK